jgi:hypothetical protein
MRRSTASRPRPSSEIALLCPPGDVVGVLAGQWLATEVAHHLGIGVEGRVEGEIFTTEGAQREPRGGEDRRAVPVDQDRSFDRT